MIRLDDPKTGFLAGILTLILGYLALESSRSSPSIVPTFFGILAVVGAIITLVSVPRMFRVFRDDSENSPIVRFASSGWAFVVIVLFILVLAALCSTGPVPGSYEACLMPAGIDCHNFHLSSDTDKLEVTLENGLQKTIIITEIVCTKANLTVDCSGVDCSPTAIPSGIEVAAANSSKFLIPCNDETGNAIYFGERDQYSGKIVVYYYFKEEGPEAKRKLIGNIYVKAG